MANTNNMEFTAAQAQSAGNAILDLMGAMGGLAEETGRIQTALEECTASFSGLAECAGKVSSAFTGFRQHTETVKTSLMSLHGIFKESEPMELFSKGIEDVVKNLGNFINGDNMEWTLFTKLKESFSEGIKSVKEFKEKLSNFSLESLGEALTTNASDIGSKVGTLLSGGIVAGIAVAAAAVAGLVAAFQYLMESNTAFRDGVTEAWEGVIEAFQPAIDAFNTLKETILGTQGSSTEFTNALLAGVILIIEGITVAVATISELIAVVLGEITELWKKHGSTISKNVTSAMESIGEIIKGMSDIVKGTLGVIAGLFKGDKAKIKSSAKTLWKGIRKVFSNAWKEIKNIFNGVGDFFEGVWKTIKKKFTSIGSSIGSSMGKAFKNVVNSVVDFAESTINKFIGSINGAIGLINKIPGVSISALPALSIPRMAEGGMVSAGQLFIARERGPELVGSFNGASGVMNNSQIVQAVSAGVYEAVKAAMGGGGEYTFNITNTLDGREIGKQVVKYHNGVVRQTGRTPLTI